MENCSAETTHLPEVPLNAVSETPPLKRTKYRSLASKFSTFTAVLLGWVLMVVMSLDVLRHKFDLIETLCLSLVVLGVVGAISRFTMKILARPLALLQQGITSVGQGKFEPIQVSDTRDEIEELGRSFNLMIAELSTSHREIQQHRELLEDRIRQRTEELEKALQAAVAASQAKSDFLANTSHELRTPMNGLLGMLDVTLDSPLAAEQRDQLETAQRCAFSLLALLNDILDLSKIEAGKLVLEKIPFDLHGVLEDCGKSFHARATQKGVSLDLEISGARCDVLGDPLRLRQIVTNLLSNAIKFTERGRVCLRLDIVETVKDRLEARIEVQDTGIGIEASKLSEIFEKFTQANGAITRKYGGTGLGLAIIKQLVEMQGGAVSLKSDVGVGSTFSITLPYERGETVKAPARPVMTARADGAPARGRLLLVEDNLVNQKVVQAILRKKAYHIDVANHGQQALEMLEASKEGYDLVLMDVQMPVLDGLDTTRIVRKNPRWKRLPIIAMTAHAMQGDRERCLLAGMNGHISKPIQPVPFLAAIDQYMEQGVDPPPAVPPSPLERELTDRLMREETEMVNDLLHVFLQLAPDRMEKLKLAAGQEDATTLSTEARKIAAAAEQLASRPLEECAQRIEQAAGRGDFETAIRDLETLRHEIQTLEALTPERASASGN